jgi:hypothetical protein
MGAAVPQRLEDTGRAEDADGAPRRLEELPRAGGSSPTDDPLPRTHSRERMRGGPTAAPDRAPAAEPRRLCAGARDRYRPRNRPADWRGGCGKRDDAGEIACSVTGRRSEAGGRLRLPPGRPAPSRRSAGGGAALGRGAGRAVAAGGGEVRAAGPGPVSALAIAQERVTG